MEDCNTDCNICKWSGQQRSIALYFTFIERDDKQLPVVVHVLTQVLKMQEMHTNYQTSQCLIQCEHSQPCPEKPDSLLLVCNENMTPYLLTLQLPTVGATLPVELSGAGGLGPGVVHGLASLQLLLLRPLLGAAHTQTHRSYISAIGREAAGKLEK